MKIEDAFARRAELEASRITVDVADGTVTLRGTARTFTAKDDAERAVWLAPGVAKVHNDIVVTP